MKKSIIFWVIIALLILLGIFGRGIFNPQPKNIPQLGTETPAQNSSSSMAGTITVKGFNSGFSPKTITVKQGDMVMLNLVSDDSPHTFTIDELNINQQFTYGKDASVMFTASKKGTFQFYCVVPGHKEAGMVGSLIIE